MKTDQIPNVLLPTDRALPKTNSNTNGASHTGTVVREGKVNEVDAFNEFFKDMKRHKSEPLRISSYDLSANACPKLAAKFAEICPHRFNRIDEAVGRHIPNSGVCENHPRLLKAARVEGPHSSISDQNERVPSSTDGDRDFTGSHTGISSMQPCETASNEPMHGSSSSSCGTVLLPRRGSSVRLESKAPPSPYSGQGECQANK